MHGRSGIVLSHVRQFNGGPPSSSPTQIDAWFQRRRKPPSTDDPNLRSQGSRRAFMNTRDQEERPAK